MGKLPSCLTYSDLFNYIFCFYRDRDRNRHSNRDKDKHHDKKKSPKEEEKKEEPKVKPEVVEKKIAEILASSGALEVSKINQTLGAESKNESIEIVQDDFNEPADIDIPGRILSLFVYDKWFL